MFEVFIVWYFRCFTQMGTKPVILSQLGIIPLSHIGNSGWKIFNNIPCLKLLCCNVTARSQFGVSLTKRHLFPTMRIPAQRNNLNETHLLWQLFGRHLESRFGIRNGRLHAFQYSHSLSHIYSKRISMDCSNDKSKNTKWVNDWQFTYIISLQCTLAFI